MKLNKRKECFSVLLVFWVLIVSISWVYADNLWKDDSAKKVNDRYKNSTTEEKNEKKETSSKPSNTETKKPALTSSKNDYDNSPYKDAIENAISKGYASEFSPGIFKPEKKIQRKEFICMVNRAFNFKKSKNSF